MQTRDCACFSYIFDEKIPNRWGGGEKKSFHGADVGFWHGSDPAAAATPAGQAMMRYLVQFASTGDPNGGNADGLPTWPKFVAGEVDGMLQLGGLGPEVAAEYVPLREEQRDLFRFMDEAYFGVNGRMGAILGPLPQDVPEPQSAM